MKLAINTDAISQDFETAVLLGIEWGVEYFELKRLYGKRIPDVEYDEISLIERVLFDNGVSLSSLAPGLFKIPLHEDLITHELKKFEQTIALANRLNTNSIVIFGFSRENGHEETEALDKIVEIFCPIAERAEREGLTLFLENDRGLWGESPSSLLQIVKGVNSPAFKLNWDPGNLIGAHPDAPFPTSYDLVQDYVGHLHIKDAIRNDNASGFSNIMMGSGDVDWLGQFERLIENDYQGYCVVEPHFGNRISSSREHILQTKRLLRQAYTNHAKASKR